jgi:hypothetical protein
MDVAGDLAGLDFHLGKVLLRGGAAAAEETRQAQAQKLCHTVAPVLERRRFEIHRIKRPQHRLTRFQKGLNDGTEASKPNQEKGTTGGRSGILGYPD